MAVNRSDANKGKATHHNKPQAKVSGYKAITTPESRHPTTHSYGVSGAMSRLKKVHK